MSHIRTQTSRIPVTELDTLTNACRALGCDLDRTATKYKWWSGQDSCQGKITDHSGGYEIGLVLDDPSGNVQFKCDDGDYMGDYQWINRKLVRDRSSGVKFDRLHEEFQAQYFRKVHQGVPGCIVKESRIDQKTGEVVIVALMA